MKKAKKKVLFRLRSMETGGVQKVMTDFMQQLSPEKYEVHLLLNLHQGEMLPLVPEHVKVEYLAKGKESFSKIPFINKVQLAFRFFKLKLYEKFPKLITKKISFIPEVEIAFTSTEYEATLNSPFKNSRKIAWFHADIRDAAATDLEGKAIANQLLLFENQVFVSNQTKDIIQEKWNITYPNGKVIYNPFNQEEIISKSKEFATDLPKDVPVFLSIGRFIDRKGYHKLVEAHATVIKNGWNHKVVVLGQGPNLGDLQQQVKDLGVEDSFLFYGVKSNPYPYIREADYFILPSKSEAYPLVIGESLVLGKPIISTRAGGVPEMMKDEENGLIVDYSSQDLAEAMQRFLEDENLVQSIKENNKTAYLNFDNAKIYKQLDELLNENS